MIKLKKLLNENEEPQRLSPEVKRHFLEIVSTYNKYQEMMDRKSDLATIAETLGGITEAARTLALQEAGDWFDAQTVKRNMSELDKLGKQFDKVASEANALDQRMHGLYEDMGHILSRYYKLGEISEDQMKQRLGIVESTEDCGCNQVTEGIKHFIHVETPKEITSKSVVSQIASLAKKGIRSNEIGLNMHFVGNEKAAVDAFQKVKNKVYFSLHKTESVNESDPCWKGYEMVGMKKKDGKEVPNCVPKK